MESFGDRAMDKIYPHSLTEVDHFYKIEGANITKSICGILIDSKKHGHLRLFINQRGL